MIFGSVNDLYRIILGLDLMPITYERDDARRCIVVTTIGDISLEEMLAVVDRQASEGTWRYGTLYDSRRVTSVANQTEVRIGLMHVDTLSRLHGRRGPVAFVTTMPAAYGMVRMYSTLAGQQQQAVEAFRDIGDAERWLAAHTDGEAAADTPAQ
jgi:hypothetical protein